MGAFLFVLQGTLSLSVSYIQTSYEGLKWLEIEATSSVCEELDVTSKELRLANNHVMCVSLRSGFSILC